MEEGGESQQRACATKAATRVIPFYFNHRLVGGGGRGGVQWWGSLAEQPLPSRHGSDRPSLDMEAASAPKRPPSPMNEQGPKFTSSSLDGGMQDDFQCAKVAKTACRNPAHSQCKARAPDSGTRRPLGHNSGLRGQRTERRAIRA